jgi:hypothetical protein
MFENQLMQVYRTREIELETRLRELPVDLVPPLKRASRGVLARLGQAVRALVGRSRRRTDQWGSPQVLAGAGSDDGDDS